MSRTLLAARAAASAPAFNAKLLESWYSDSGLTDDGGGLISSWVGRKDGYAFAAVAGERPTNTAQQYALVQGLVFNGSSNTMKCSTIGTLLSGKTGVTVIMVLQGSSAGFHMLLEYGGDWGTAGNFGILKNNQFTANLVAHATFEPGKDSDWYGDADTAPMSAAGVLCATFDSTLATNETTVTLNDAAMSGSRPVNPNSTGSLANRILYLASRAGTNYFQPMSLGAVNIYDVLTAGEQTAEIDILRAKFGTP